MEGEGTDGVGDGLVRDGRWEVSCGTADTSTSIRIPERPRCTGMYREESGRQVGCFKRQGNFERKVIPEGTGDCPT